MTDKRKEALDSVAEWQISRLTGNPDLEHDKAKAMLKAVTDALTQPQPVMGEDGIIEVINKAIADADIILKRSGDAATPIYRALKSSGIIKTDGGK
jgi:hypothetical protein